MIWDIRGAVSIDAYNLVAVWAVSQAPATVLRNCLQVGFSHAKITPADIDNHRIDLEPVDGDGPKDGRRLAGRRTGSQADDGHALNLGRVVWRRVEKRRYQNLFPGTIIIELVWVIHRMDSLPVIYAQQGIICLLYTSP